MEEGGDAGEELFGDQPGRLVGADQDLGRGGEGLVCRTALVERNVSGELLCA